jgi:hypothetical protein
MDFTNYRLHVGKRVNTPDGEGTLLGHVTNHEGIAMVVVQYEKDTYFGTFAFDNIHVLDDAAPVDRDEPEPEDTPEAFLDDDDDNL